MVFLFVVLKCNDHSGKPEVKVEALENQSKTMNNVRKAVQKNANMQFRKKEKIVTKNKTITLMKKLRKLVVNNAEKHFSVLKFEKDAWKKLIMTK